MLSELIIRFKKLFDLGFKQDQNGIMHRYIQEIENWESHLENSKKSIENFIANKSCESVAILGSGWLLDVPMELLMNRFKEIHLYDIVHPKQIQYKYKNSSQVFFHTKDLTFGLADAIHNIHSIDELLEIASSIKQIDFFQKFDVIISLNILNQLDSLLIECLPLKNKLKSTTEKKLRQTIQQKHIDALPKGKSCLISDVRALQFSMAGDLINTKQLIFAALPQNSKVDEWIWNFDTKATYSKNCKTKFEVEVYCIK